MKAILFDFGGTLDTDGIHWSEKFWDKYKLFSVPVSKKYYEEAYVYSEGHVSGLIEVTDDLKTTLKKQVMLQVEYLIDTKKIMCKSKNDLIEEITSSCCNDVSMNIGVIINVLKYLSYSFKLGVVSNYYGNLSATLKGLGILNYFDVVVDSQLVGYKKPNPKIFQEAISKIGVKASDVFVIGDSYDRDVQPSKTLGCKTIWLNGRSWEKTDNTADADYIIKSLKEVETLYYLINKN